MASEAIAASALAWGAIAASTKVELRRWVWLPAFRAGAALSLALTGLLLLGLPVPRGAPAGVAVLGLLAGLALARSPWNPGGDVR